MCECDRGFPPTQYPGLGWVAGIHGRCGGWVSFPGLGDETRARRASYLAERARPRIKR